MRIAVFLFCVIFIQTLSTVLALGWTSKECPIDSIQENRDNYLCIRPCDYEEAAPSTPGRSQHGKNSDDGYFIVFFPPKGKIDHQPNRLKCPAGFKQVSENKQCFCERPYTPYELEVQRREKCSQAFEKCRMYGLKHYDCNHIVDACPNVMIRDYCLAGKVYKMRFASVVYEFCHAFLRLPNDGRRHFLEPDIDRIKRH